MAVPALVAHEYLTRYRAAASGNSFLALQNASAGLALPAFSGTAQTMVLWNKSTNKNLALMDVAFALVSGTAWVIGDFGFALIVAGTGLGTPISASVAIATVYQMSTFNAASSADWSWCSATVAAPTVFIPWGIGCTDAYAVNTTTAPQVTSRVHYDGGLIIPPGVAFCACGMVAQDELHHVAITFKVESV